MINNKQILLNSRPLNYPTHDNFKETTTIVSALSMGETLLETLYISLDPYVRGRMNDAPSYVPPLHLGEVMPAGGVCRVIESRNPMLKPGQLVFSYCGWQEYSILGQNDLAIPIDSKLFNPVWALSVLGMTSMTAYLGIVDIGKPKAGETFVVSAAAGAVGSIAGQIAKQLGCRVVGIAGSSEKCTAVKKLGFDECIDHSESSWVDQLKKICPKGIDIYFENVGGKIFQSVFPLLNNHSRVALCGLSSVYNNNQLKDQPDISSLLLAGILTRRITIQGFINFDHRDRFSEFANKMLNWLQQGTVKPYDTITPGLSSAPQVFINQMQGLTMGKQIISIKSGA